MNKLWRVLAFVLMCFLFAVTVRDLLAYVFLGDTPERLFAPMLIAALTLCEWTVEEYDKMNRGK